MYYTLLDLQKKYEKTHSTLKVWLENDGFPGAFKDDKWYIPVESVDGRDVEEIEKIAIENKIAKKREELVGRKFGELEIIDVIGEKLENGKQKRLFVEVGCECGNIVEMPYYNIERGSQKYCSNQCPCLLYTSSDSASFYLDAADEC